MNRRERVKTCKNYVIGREITTILKIAVNRNVAAFHFRCVTNKIVFTTLEAPVARCFAFFFLQFCVDFLRIYAIEVNSLAV